MKEKKLLLKDQKLLFSSSDQKSGSNKLKSETETMIQLLIASFFISSIVSGSATGPRVNTSSGRIEGFHLEDQQVDVFLGIPFAKPPVGPLRFRLPEPVQPWHGIRNATKYESTCYQVLYQSDFVGDTMWNPMTNLSEDCLYLNIWVPTPRRSDLLSVMVWIHGGGLTTGSIARPMFDGKYLADEGDVIVVTVAYRLGVLGFLYLDDESAPGNQGLFDQTMALRWVHENIENFGGDPNQVTIFGCSAGGSSVVNHLFSGVSQKFYQRAIIQSSDVESILNNIAEDAPSYRSLAIRYATSIGCPNSNDSAIISDCLRKLEPERLAATQSYLPAVRTFNPVVDKHFLPDSPKKLLSTGQFKQCPIIFGNVVDEGTYFVAVMLSALNIPIGSVNKDQFARAAETLIKFLGYFPHLNNPNYMNELVSLFANKYNPINTERAYQALSEMAATTCFLCPAAELANIYNQYGQDVYNYVLTQRYERTPWPQWTGVVHGDDIFFVFGSAPAPGLDFIGEEITLSKAIMRYWSNFAKTGDPNRPEKRGTLGKWMPYKSSTGYRRIDLNARFLSNGPNARSANMATGNLTKICEKLSQILT